MTERVVLPGATLGMLGSGQLGRMFTAAAHRMGYRVHVFSPSPGSPAGLLADEETVAGYDDAEAVRRFAGSVALITLEFENIPTAALEAAEAVVPVRPGVTALATCQHRGREKRFLAQRGLPHVPFVEVEAGGDLDAAVAGLDGRCVVKTAGFGYDGKGQVVLTGPDDEVGMAAARLLAQGQAVLVERWVELAMEVSVVIARATSGAAVTYAPIQNRHRDQILDLSSCPAAIDHALTSAVSALARTVVEALDLVGVACVEFFLSSSGDLLINEIAPRPHNSGHLTIEAAETSQFEQQLRAITGLPLGSTAMLRPAAMANLLGELWGDGEPDWAAALATPGAALHLYGKTEARPGRKMGHVTATAPTRVTAERRVLEARRLLRRT